MTERWLPAWGLTSVALGGASLIVPLYVVELGGTAASLGFLFATGSFVGVPGALVFGNLADRTGKRRVFVVVAMIVTAATMATIPLVDSIPLVVAANALLWLGFAAAIPVLTLLVVAGEPEDRWSTLIAHLNKYQGVGWALGLALGFVVIAGGSRLVDPITAQRYFFVACAGSAGVGLLLGVRRLPPDPRPGRDASPRRLRQRVRQAARFNIRGAAFPFTPARFDARDLHPRTFLDRFTPQLATYFGAVFLVFTGFGVFFAPLPAYLSGEGYSASEIFALYLVLNVGAAVFYGRAAELAGKHDVIRVHMSGLLARGIALPVVGLSGVALGATSIGLGAVGLVFVVIGLTWAVIAVTAATLVTRLSPAAIRGEALGVYGALVAVGGGVGGLFGGWLAGIGFVVAFGVAGGLVVVGTGVVAVLSRQQAAARVHDVDTAIQ